MEGVGGRVNQRAVGNGIYAEVTVAVDGESFSFELLFGLLASTGSGADVLSCIGIITIGHRGGKRGVLRHACARTYAEFIHYVEGYIGPFKQNGHHASPREGDRDSGSVPFR